ncbi:MAG: GNAT family N-acetyltransferase [Prevotella sp.]|nr:GNAT family N-acetyltransferase [Prevotella sp.]
MPAYSTKIYTSGNTLPQGLMEDHFFHSSRFYTLCQQTPRHRPYMVALEDAEGTIVAQMMAVVRYRTSWFPPYYYMHCRIMGEGVYRDEAKGDTFGQMLQALTSRLGQRMLYVEVSHLSAKMFGYKQLRDNRYFPVRWMSIHNSLHSRTPEERITPQMQQRIDNAYERGVVTNEVASDQDMVEFIKLLRHHNWLKPKRYIPADEFFHQLREQPDNGRLFLTRYKGHIIGCSAVIYSHRQAYLWYAAYRRKTFALVHPRELTIWHAIKDAHSRGFEHIFFMDVGLPFRKNKFRDFILRFGGKPVSTYRWFRCSIKWINSLLSWIYRD